MGFDKQKGDAVDMNVGDILTVVEIGSFSGGRTRVKFDNGTKATVEYLVVLGDKFKVSIVRGVNFRNVIDFELIEEDFNKTVKS